MRPDWRPGRRAGRAALADAAAVPLGRRRSLAGLWIALAAALATRGRVGRRAGLRALASAAGASAVANLLLKPLARRPRPRPGVSSRLLGARRVAGPWSFPSSHAATAAAFAAGAAQELPAAGPPLALLAAAAGWSRVRGRAHHRSDVAAGAVLGTAVAMATRRAWPVAPRARPHPAATLRRRPGHASPTGAGLTIVVNAEAGPALRPSPADGLAADLPDARVMEVEGGRVVEALEDAAAGGARALGAAGGDGTANAAAGIAHRHGLPLVVVPAGTLNHLARDLGLDSPDEAVAAVVSGTTTDVDLAAIDGKPFLNTASLGSYVDLVDARERLQDRIGKWPAVMVALVRVLRRSTPVRVELDGRERRVWMVFVGNCRYHPSGFAPSWRERLDDGVLDVRVVDASEPWSRLRLVASVLTGRLGRCRAYEQRAAERLEIRSLEGPLRLARDGETFDGSAGFVVEKLGAPLAVYVPGA